MRSRSMSHVSTLHEPTPKALVPYWAERFGLLVSIAAWSFVALSWHWERVLHRHVFPPLGCLEVLNVRDI